MRETAIMKLAYYSEKKLKKEIKKIIGKYLDLKKYKVFFFGSRVKGSKYLADDRSDIDIGIEGPKVVPSDIMSNIEEEISEILILYRIDIVDFRDVSDDFYEVAKQNIEVIK